MNKFLANLTPDMKVGSLALNIPASLKSIFPEVTFRLTKTLPGVYVVFFPHNNTVYIGQSKDISREVSMLRGGYRSQPAVNEAFKQSGKNATAYAIAQGPGLSDRKMRLELEKILISRAGKQSINIVNNPNFVFTRPLKDPNIKEVEFVAFKGDWRQYNLNYPNLPPVSGQGCIYLFLNPKTLSFYIGQSDDFIKAKVLKRHRTYIRQVQNISLRNQTVRGYEYYQRILRELTQPAERFFYSIIEYTNQVPTEQRKIIEENYIKDAFSSYPSRLYNIPFTQQKINIRKRSEESKELNRLSANIAKLEGQSKKGLDTSSYPCIIKGKWFDTMEEANKAEGFSYRSGIKGRLLSPKYPEYIWLKDPKGKDILLTEEIKKKIKDFYLNKAIYYKETINSQYKNPISIYYQKISNTSLP